MKNVSCTVAAQSVSNTIMVLTLQICRFLLKQQKKSGDFLFLRSFSTFSIKQLWFVFQPLFAKFLQLLAFFVDGLLQLLLLLVQIGQFL